jgi:hypothetical protein
MHQVTLLSLARIFHKPWKRHYSVFAPHLSPTILRAGLAVGGLRNRRATRPPAHFQRNPPGRGRWLFFRVARPNPYDSDMDALPLLEISSRHSAIGSEPPGVETWREATGDRVPRSELPSFKEGSPATVG